MPEKVGSRDKTTFQQRIAGKSLDELEISINSRLPLLNKKGSEQIKADIALLNERQKSLQRLLGKTDIEEIDQSIQRRKAGLKLLDKNPDKAWEKSAKIIEIQTLEAARSREYFKLRVGAKTPAELSESLKSREKSLTGTGISIRDNRVLTEALVIIRERRAELQRHEQKSSPREIEAGIAMRLRMIGAIKGGGEVQTLQRSKLTVEVNLLQQILDKIQPKIVVKAERTKTLVKKAELGPEKVKKGERIGKHGVIITPLVEDGVRINGNKLRQGVDATRTVSLKSSEQYEDNFKDLYSAELSGNELSISVPGAKEKLIAKKRERMKILKLITIAYMSDNFEMKNFLERDCGFKGDTYDKAARPALAYLRYLVENRVGNALESDDKVVKGLGNPVILEQNLRKILDVINKDVHGMTTNFQNELSSRIPHVKTTRVEDRDTLHLGLLIRQFKDNNDARKEHKIDDLIERFR